MMILKSVLLLISMVGVVAGILPSEVCYGKYGCFTKEGSLLRALVQLPQSPEQIGTTFRLFTREQSTEHILDDSDEEKLSSSTFDGTRRTIFLIHGWTENGYVPWMNRMRHALLAQEDVNLITTDWQRGARQLYGQSTGNTQLVGAQVAELIKFLIKNTGTSADRFYVVGFSLGGQISGYAGARMRGEGQPIGRITALDPAGPYFTNEATNLRLDPTDAQFVDVIHTSFLGEQNSVGHIDFYVNGGLVQPKGCTEVPYLGELAILATLAGATAEAICDHMRCPDFYTESVNPNCPWNAYPCDSLHDFNHGQCLDCNGVCPQMGYNAQSTTGDSTGRHILLTNQSPEPFCAYHYLVTFKTSTRWLAGLPFGQIIIRIVGSGGDSGEVHLKRRLIIEGSDESFVALSRTDLGDLRSIKVRFQGALPLEEWRLVSAVVKPGWETTKYTACFNTWIKGTANGEERDFEEGNIPC